MSATSRAIDSHASQLVMNLDEQKELFLVFCPSRRTDSYRVVARGSFQRSFLSSASSVFEVQRFDSVRNREFRVFQKSMHEDAA